MILELDVGNSRIKWRVLNRDAQAGTRHPGALMGGAEDAAAKLFESIPRDLQLSAARGCSVGSELLLVELAESLKARWGLELDVAEVSAQCGGITNSYQEVGRMGVDRWLAMIAAFNRQKRACLIVDAGTALTIDLVADDGLHQGGYILAGLSMAVEALENNTGITLRNRDFSPLAGPGTSTEQAVLGGAMSSTVSLILEALGRLRCTDSEAMVYLCGGDAELLAQALRLRGESGFTVEPDLVLDGLEYACGNQ